MVKVKIEAQPLCLACGKPIARYTETHFLREAWEDDQSKWITKPEDIPTDEEVMSVRYAPNKAITNYNTWDGETYVDAYFCTVRCTIDFARTRARISGALFRHKE